MIPRNRYEGLKWERHILHEFSTIIIPLPII
jgi:hypothetical protein